MAWPMCSWPVTFGGGMTMVNGFLLRSIWGMEIPLVAPVLIDAILGALRGILFGEFLRHSVNLLVNVRGVIFTFGQIKKAAP